jgi:hypothetical protein
MIEGRWKVVKYDIPKIGDVIEQQVMHAPDSLKNDYRELLTNNANKMKEEVMKSTFEFKRDKSFNILTSEGNHNGRWSLSPDGKKLYSTDSAASYTDTFYIVTLTKKDFEFKITNVMNVETVIGLEKLN